MKSAFSIACAVVALLPLAGCGNHRAEVDACVDRGVTYFKEIGSFPTLSSAGNEGKYVADVARERCNRTTTAF